MIMSICVPKSGRGLAHSQIAALSPGSVRPPTSSRVFRNGDGGVPSFLSPSEPPNRGAKRIVPSRSYASFSAVVLAVLLDCRPQRGFHPCDPDVLHAGDASGVYPEEHLDAVPGPGGALGWRDAGVQPPGNSGMSQVVRAAHQRRGELGRGQGQRSGLGPDLPVGGWLDRGTVLAAKQAAGLAGSEPLHMDPQQATSSGGIGTLRVARRAAACRGRPFSPRCSWTWPVSVKSFPAAWLASANISLPQ